MISRIERSLLLDVNFYERKRWATGADGAAGEQGGDSQARGHTGRGCDCALLVIGLVVSGEENVNASTCQW